MIHISLALLLLGAIAAPHFVALHRASPRLAAAVWLLALMLRALVAVGAALFFVVYLPQTGVYEAAAEWCWHEVLPVVSEQLGFSGHPLTHAAVVLPGLALALSLVWLAFGLARAWLSLRRLLRRAVGEGPLGSTVVPDPRVVVAAAALGRGRILVSAGALGALDEQELAASLAHERGHIARRHRPLILVAMTLAALGRLVPGTRAAERQLTFSLERDADDYAVRATRDPLALASAICKAAVSNSPGITALGGRGSTTLRVEELLEEGPPRPDPVRERSAHALATLLTLLVLSLTVSLPGWALAAPRASAVVVETDLCHPH